MEQVKRPNTNTSTIQNTEINKFIVELQGFVFACLCWKLLVEVFFVPQGENYRGVATAVLCHFILRFPDWYLGKLECFVASGDSMSCKALIYDGTTF